ncbi:bifunctional demethylmenaquinone methyltransferase/2-methoxy-6-polyprenyl-1,4-benzoquinol methylase UbiE [Alkalitalea saponilacus]|uniref:Demethylmenaquinone methyltransferase n=1 Tax=Alkalitalea saponilacus TaxID=889453 RepID=A0A1T5C908_9BACT|nr:bifunctional demethylmenaquinone methyltransferase/2-methoxy-6-polyprenyl-1,4-benzoquinol methylase UbiE [Alkalitalea saponilacus]ASB49778.1 bifunctional demethylmenaquinone methyltransferase/2-methoxy-6-polyprenyl-1,4-benzoquinol methylase [Alkalitalea saponilacus]SKB55881.1 demethylmenaquinone methyltransferase / 2-methoxy-6-polyprenyl-1,4-benzoquinol methylase [Alkalitalea saponilacus]
MDIVPYTQQRGTKKEQVTYMFNKIAPQYDLLNHLFSFGIDKDWRRKVVDEVKKTKNPVILDVATGTGDLALALAASHPTAIHAIDISPGMLNIAKKKVLSRGLQNTIMLTEADSEAIPFPNGKFDVATVAFGVRNFGDLNLGLIEINRVLKRGGKIIVLEFSRPNVFPMKQFYRCYFNRLIPFCGALFSKDREAYSYLSASVMAFPEGKEFEQELMMAGFDDIKTHRLSLGIASIYIATKSLQ